MKTVKVNHEPRPGGHTNESEMVVVVVVKECEVKVRKAY